jgi:spermidine synthase
LGLGGGIVSGQINYYLGHNVDAVELDSRIIDLSDQYFDQLLSNVNKVSDDARRYVKSTSEKYDFIIDCPAEFLAIDARRFWDSECWSQQRAFAMLNAHM